MRKLQGNKFHRLSRQAALAAFLALGLAGCGGGGDSPSTTTPTPVDGGSTPEPVDGGRPGAGGGNPNSQYPLPGLSGNLYYVTFAEKYNGKTNPYGVFNFASQNFSPIFDVKIGSIVSASRDASGFIAVDYGHAAYFFDSKENVFTTVMAPLNRRFRLTKLSFDKEMYATLLEPTGLNWLAIYSKQGALVKEFAPLRASTMFRLGYLSFEWLPTGGLVFSSDDSIYIVSDLQQGEPQPIATFRGYDVGNIAVSADGTRVAFTLTIPLTKDQAGDVYVMGLDGSDPRQLTQSSRTVGISWSPDDRYLATIEENYAWAVGGQVAPGTDGCPDVYIMPSTGESIAIIGSEDPSPAFRLQERKNGQLKDVCIRDTSIDWRK